jgi:DnaJ like chaperone protein
MLRNDELLFVLLGRLAKCDGRVAEGHILQARQEMQALEMTEPAKRRAIAAFNPANRATTGCAVICDA